MKKEKEKTNTKNNSLIIGLACIITILILGLAFLFLRYEHLNDLYDDLKEHETPNLNTNNQNNNSNNNQNANTSDYISRSSAITKALNDLNLKESDVRDLDVELEYKNRYNAYIYEVSFDYQAYEYEYIIDAKTGSILDSLKSWD